MKLVFVSSTFRDMQFERDALNTRVVPRINQFLERYSETVHFGDLRWGVNTTELESEESSKKVLKVCLDQIDDCKPYMIIFIGERYGWIPSADLLYSAALLKGMDVSAIKEDTSVTELEIEYGALLNPDYEGRILFYFRNPFDMSQMSEAQRADYISESPLHKEKVEQLKAQIKEKYPDYIRYYDVSYDADTQKLVGLEPLMDQIYEDLQRIFDLDLTYLNALPDEERALANSKNHFEKMAADSYFRELSAVNEFDYDAFEYNYQMRFENNPVFEVITGPHGIGAKTLVAQKYRKTLESGYNAVCFSYNIDEFTNSADKMLSALCYQMEAFMELPHGTKANVEHFASLCRKYTERAELPYLYFYMVNLPVSAMTVFHKLAALYPHLFGIGFCVHFRGQITAETPLPFFLKNRILEVPMLGADEVGEMVNAILKSKRKELPPIVIDEIKKHSAANLPLYLSLLVERLLILDSEDFAVIREHGDGMDNINAYMIDLIRHSGDNVTEIAKELLEELAERVNPVMVPHLVTHLTEQYQFDVEGIRQLFTFAGWKYSDLDYTLFKKSFPSLMYQDSSGYLWYANEDIKAAARRLVTQWGCEKDYQTIKAYLDTLKPEYAIRSQMKYYGVWGDTQSFVNATLIYLDGTRHQQGKETVGERCLQGFHHVLCDQIRENSEFAFSVATALFEAIAKGQMQYPYDLIAYLMQCIPSYSLTAEEVPVCYDFLVRLEAYIIKLRQSCQDEVLVFAHCALRTLHMGSLIIRLGVREMQEEMKKHQKYMAGEGKVWSRKLLEIGSEKRLPIYDQVERISTDTFLMYANVMEDDSPRTHPLFRGLYNVFSGVERYALANYPNYYERFLGEGDEAIPAKELHTHALFLAIWGFYNFHISKIDLAKKCYDAFYALFAKHFKDNPPDAHHRAIYLSAVRNYCQFLIQHESEAVIQARFEELFLWCLARMVEPPLTFDTAYQLMELHNAAEEKNCVSISTKHFYVIFGQLLCKAPTQMLHPSKAWRLVRYFNKFASLFTDEERIHYFKEMIFALTNGILKDAKWKPKIIFETLSELIILFDREWGVEITQLMEEIFREVVQVHPQVFRKAPDKHVADGLKIGIRLSKKYNGRGV